MPTFNRGWVIRRAIESVLKQTFSDFELIVIDDGSTDNTQEILSSFTDKRLGTVRQGTNSGTAVVRNIGLKKSGGGLIAYLDSDNLWYPNFLEVMTSELTSELVLAYSGQNTLLVGGDRKNPSIIGRKVRNETYNPARLTYENFIDINAVVHKREVLEEVGYFDESLKSLEDWDLFVRIAIRYPFRIKHVDQVLGEYYFFLKETTSTVENTSFSEEALLDYFGIRKPIETAGDGTKILDKIKTSIGDTGR